MKAAFWILLALVTITSSISSAANCTLSMRVDGTIGPATLDFIERGFHRADENQCPSILLLINTPGGNLQSTRLIVEKIINSPRPILCLVHPSGGHAGSAGAIILQACHVSGAMETTNLGAATPVSSMGQEMPEDVRKKILNDTLSWVEGLAKLRNRDVKFAKEIVEDAKAVDAKEAVELKAIETVVESIDEFTDFAKGRKVGLANGAEAEVQVGALIPFQQDLRYKILEITTDPQFAYMIFMGSLGLLYFELTHPGVLVPGIIGGVGLILSLVSFHKLNVDWAGILLIVLGIGLMVAEAIVPAFGALGLGGVAAFIFGGVLLFDTASTGAVVPWTMIFIPAVVFGALSLFLGRLAVKNFRGMKAKGAIELRGEYGVVVELGTDGGTGQVELQGEIWNFKSDNKVGLGDRVEVYDQKGLTLWVR